MSKTTDTWFRILKGMPLTEQKTCIPGTVYNPSTRKCEPSSAAQQPKTPLEQKPHVEKGVLPGSEAERKAWQAAAAKRKAQQAGQAAVPPARQNVTKKVQQIAKQPSKGKSAIAIAQSVAGDILYGDAHLPKEKRKLKPDGIVGPLTLGAFANVGIPPSLIGDDPKNRRNRRLATRNIDQVRKVLSQKYDAALPHIGADPKKALAVAQAVKTPEVKPAKPEAPSAAALEKYPDVIASIATDVKKLAAVFIPKEDPASPPVDRLKSKAEPAIATVVPTDRGTATLDPIMAAAVTKLQQDAVAAGFKLRDFQPAGAVSGFRSIKAQERGWEANLKRIAPRGEHGRTVAKTIKYEPGSSRPWVAYWRDTATNRRKGRRGVFSRSKTRRGALEKILRQFVARPATVNKKTGEVKGGSPHMSGRAIDFKLKYGAQSKRIKQMEKLPEYKWLQQNAAKYGLKQYGDEPWHWEMDEVNHKYLMNKMAANLEKQKGNEEKAAAYNQQAQQAAGLAESKKLNLKEGVKIKISKKNTLTEAEWPRGTGQLLLKARRELADTEQLVQAFKAAYKKNTGRDYGDEEWLQQYAEKNPKGLERELSSLEGEEPTSEKPDVDEKILKKLMARGARCNRAGFKGFGHEDAGDVNAALKSNATADVEGNKYDVETLKAVIAFQKEKGLKVDGCVGPNTGRAMGIEIKKAGTVRDRSSRRRQLDPAGKCRYIKSVHRKTRNWVGVGNAIAPGTAKFPYTEHPTKKGRIIISPEWRRANWTRVTLHNGKRVRLHKAVADSFVEAFKEASEKSGYAPSSVQTSVTRHMRWDPKMPLSNHTFGTAVDLDPSDNPAGSRSGAIREYPEFINIMNCHGWLWGGDWRDVDDMHFEFDITKL